MHALQVGILLFMTVKVVLWFEWLMLGQLAKNYRLLKVDWRGPSQMLCCEREEIHRHTPHRNGSGHGCD